MVGFLGVLFLFLSDVVCLLLVLLFVSMFVLSERKILGYVQLRKGPNKVGFGGLLQSFADLLKLVIKSKILFFNVRGYLPWVGILLLMLVSCIYCCFLVCLHLGVGGDDFLLWVLVVGSIAGYSLLILGWASQSKYSLISGIRVSFVSVSFEACWLCVIVMMALVYGNYSGFGVYSYVWWSVLVVPLVYLFWLVGVLCECNRTPFDYGEAESELVSGLSVEYSGVVFTCFFACEYVMIFVFSWLTSFMFFGGSLVLVSSVLHSLGFIWCRATLPRIRYDHFVDFFWGYVLVVLVWGLFVVL